MKIRKKPHEKKDYPNAIGVIRVGNHEKEVTIKELKALQKGVNKLVLSDEDNLFSECWSRNYNCSITYQQINDYSVEIYQGYRKGSYKLIYYTDGHLTRKKAIKKALKFIKNKNKK